MIDLDGFKQINDRDGHEAGDSVLQEVASRMRGMFRDCDVVARFGGDEFAVLLTDLESTEALASIMDRLLLALAQPVGLSQYRNLHQVQWNLTMAATLVVMAPVIILFFFAQRAFVEGVTLTGVKG